MRVHVRGSAGYFCAGLADKARFEIDNNAGWGLGDNMYAGTVTVRGNAGAIAGVAIRGVEIVVHGNVGSRAGQVMKAGTLCCVGNANFMAGYMMYGGRIIILGESGERVGEDMAAGDIYVGGAVRSLGSDAQLTDIEEAEVDDIRAFLDRHEIAYKGGFQKIVNAGKRLRYGDQRAAGAQHSLLHLLGRGHGRRPSDGGGNANRDRGPQRGEGAQALHAGDGRADELRRALALDQAGGGHGVEHGGDRREYRRRRHERRPAGRGGSSLSSSAWAEGSAGTSTT